jgi:type IV pilus assembly protein PilX
MNCNEYTSQDGRAERGVAMITVLMFLVIMTLIGLAAMQSSGLQERMSGNMRDQDVAFQATENALREGETWINGLTTMPIISASGSGNCDPYCASAVWALDATEVSSGNFLNHAFWDESITPLYRAGTAVSGANTAPKFVVEYNQFISDPTSGLTIGQPSDDTGRQLFRVTARGTGETDASRSVIQSTFAKRLN